VWRTTAGTSFPRVVSRKTASRHAENKRTREHNIIIMSYNIKHGQRIGILVNIYYIGIIINVNTMYRDGLRS